MKSVTSKSSTSSANNTESRVRDLYMLIQDLARLHGELVRIIEAKTQAIRGAHSSELADLMQEERTLVERIQERDGLRRQLLDAIGRNLGMAQAPARGLTISKLAKLLPSSAAVLVSAANRLRAELESVQRANRKLAIVAGSLVHHLQWVFAAVRPQADKPAGYTQAGAVRDTSGQRIVDAVG